MRWTPEVRTTPYGTMRDQSGFLWFPKCLGGEWRWLERASWTQRWSRGWIGTVHAPGSPSSWVSVEWLPYTPL